MLEVDCDLKVIWFLSFSSRADRCLATEPESQKAQLPLSYPTPPPSRPSTIMSQHLSNFHANISSAHACNARRTLHHQLAPAFPLLKSRTHSFFSPPSNFHGAVTGGSMSHLHSPIQDTCNLPPPATLAPGPLHAKKKITHTRA